MKVESNLNRRQKVHDCLKYEPVEKQVYDILMKDDFFDVQGYNLVHDGFIGFSSPRGTYTVGFDCGDYAIYFGWKDDAFYLCILPFIVDSESYLEVFSYKFNVKHKLDMLKKTISSRADFFKQLIEFRKWADENIVKKNKACVDYASKFFEGIENVKFSFDKHPDNMISRNRTISISVKNCYDKKNPVGSSFNIEDGKVEIQGREMSYLLGGSGNCHNRTVPEMKKIMLMGDKVQSALEKMDFNTVPEYVEWRKKKDEAVKILLQLPGSKQYLIKNDERESE